MKFHPDCIALLTLYTSLSFAPNVSADLVRRAKTEIDSNGNVSGGLHPKASRVQRFLSGSGSSSDSKSSSKSKKKKKKKKKAKPGYKFGMLKEVVGFWVGEEVFLDTSIDCGPFAYCSTAVFDDSRGRVSDDNLLIFQSAFVAADTTGDDTTSCADVNVNPITGEVSGDWFRTLDAFKYVLNIEQKKCLKEIECPYDVTTSPFFSDYSILKKSCGEHLKYDIQRDVYNCESFQVNLLEKNDTKEKLIVNVLSYSGGVEGGYDNVECPTQPTFDFSVLENDENMIGQLLFVKQNCIPEIEFDECDNTSTDDWECVDEMSV